VPCSSLVPVLSDSVSSGLGLVPRSSLVLLLGDSVSPGLALLRSSLAGALAAAPSRSPGGAVARGLPAVARGFGDPLLAGEAAPAGDLPVVGGAVAAGEPPAVGDPATPAPVVVPVETPVAVVRETPAPISAPGLRRNSYRCW